MNEFLQQFLIESRDLVEQATEGLLLLEHSPLSSEHVDSVFRAFHTLKGGAGIVEFAMMEQAVHRTENLLTEVRTGLRAMDAALVGVCLARLDQVSGWLDALERTGELPPQDSAPPSTEAEGPGPEAGSAAVRRTCAPWISDLAHRHPGVAGQSTVAFRFTPDPDCFYHGQDPIAWVTAMPKLLALELEPAAPWAAAAEFDAYVCNLVLTGLAAGGVDEVQAHLQDQSGVREVAALARTVPTAIALPEIVRAVLIEQLELLGVTNPAGAVGRRAAAGRTAANALRFCDRDSDARAVATASERDRVAGTARNLQQAIGELLGMAKYVAAAVPVATQADPPSPVSVRSLRVEARQIDALVRLTGELTVAKNAIAHTAELAQAHGETVAGALKQHHEDLHGLIRQLQNAVVAMRMLPLRSVFQRFPRVLRDMSGSLGKQVELRVEGEETEADKVIVDMLFEPLLHVVRNALDHGIESPDRRRAEGKPALAVIWMRATRDADHVLIEVSDDGAGIDVERVRRVAKERRIASPEEVDAMSDPTVVDLVFAPGFSTAARVTQISGRGVGMDAVRSAVERIGGRVSIASRAGHGTTVSFAVPFSVLMTQVMTVEAGGQIFGIPLDAVVETLRVDPASVSGVGEARVVVHRNRTVPVVDLGEVLNAGSPIPPNEGDIALVITAVSGYWVALRVDRPGERMDVMLKPLDGLLSGTPGIAGTTVLGDGRVLLVLDLQEVLR